MLLLRHRDFLVILGAWGLSALGDYVALVVLTLEVHDATGSGYAVAGLLVAAALPLIVVAPVAGWLVDRFETRRVLALSALFQAAVAVALAFSPPWAILALTFLLGAGNAVDGPALFALVPRMVGDEHTGRANGYLEAAKYVGLTLGPLLGGILAATAGTRAALLLDAGTFLVAALAACALRARRHARVRTPGEPEEGARAGLRFLARDRLLRLLVGVLCATVVFAAMANVAEVFFAKDVLVAGDEGYGALVAAWGIGMIGGAALAAPALRRSALPVAVLVAALLMGVGLAVPAVWLGLPVALVAFAVGGAANGASNVAMRTLIHVRVPDRLRGRVFAAYFGISSAANLLAMALGGLVVEWLAARGALLFTGLGAVAAAVGGALLLGRLPVAERRSEAAAPYGRVPSPGSV